MEALRQPLLVEREVGEEFGVVAEGQSLDHGGVDFGMRRFDVGERFGVAQGEDVFFDGVGAVVLSPPKGIRDSPGIPRESLGELDFYHAIGFQGGREFRDESAVGFAAAGDEVAGSPAIPVFDSPA